MNKLLSCAQNGNISELKRLMNQSTLNDIYNTLIWVSKNGKADLIPILLENKNIRDKLINKRDDKGFSALQYANMVSVENAENLNTVNSLIQQGAKIDIKDDDDSTPLMYAAQLGYFNIAQSLIKHKASVNEKNKLGKTALMYAAESKHAGVVNLLIQNKAAIDIKNSLGKTALMYACAEGYDDIAQLLILNKACVNAKDENGCSPLVYAACYGHYNVANLLINHKAHVNSQANNASTPLRAAVQNNDSAMVMLLLKNGAQGHASVLQHRNLHNVFNDSQLFKIFNLLDKMNHEAGFYKEAGAYIYQYFTQFMDEIKLHVEFSDIIQTLENSSPWNRKSIDDIVTKIKNGQKMIIEAGHKAHSIPCLLQYVDDHVELSLYDRGEYSQKAQDSQFVLPKRTISIPDKNMDKVIELIMDATQADSTKAKRILFTEIPGILNQNYKFASITQRPFKRGQCYFENFKSLILGELTELAGDVKGRILYKEFDLFMHIKTLENYKTYCKDNPGVESEQKEIIKRCEEIIQKKQYSLLHMTLAHDDFYRITRILSQMKHFACTDEMLSSAKAYPKILTRLNCMNNIQLALNQINHPDSLKMTDNKILKNSAIFLKQAYEIDCEFAAMVMKNKFADDNISLGNTDMSQYNDKMLQRLCCAKKMASAFQIMMNNTTHQKDKEQFNEANSLLEQAYQNDPACFDSELKKWILQNNLLSNQATMFCLLENIPSLKKSTLPEINIQLGCYYEHGKKDIEEAYKYYKKADRLFSAQNAQRFSDNPHMHFYRRKTRLGETKRHSDSPSPATTFQLPLI